MENYGTLRFKGIRERVEDPTAFGIQSALA